MDNRRMDSRNRVPMEDSLNRVPTVNLLLLPSSRVGMVSHRLGVTDSLQERTDKPRLVLTVNPRVRRLTGKVKDNLPLPTDKDNPRLLFMVKLNLLPLTEHPHL